MDASRTLGSTGTEKPGSWLGGDNRRSIRYHSGIVGFGKASPRNQIKEGGWPKRGQPPSSFLLINCQRFLQRQS